MIRGMAKEKKTTGEDRGRDWMALLEALDVRAGINGIDLAERFHLTTDRVMRLADKNSDVLDKLFESADTWLDLVETFPPETNWSLLHAILDRVAMEVMTANRTLVNSWRQGQRNDDLVRRVFVVSLALNDTFRSLPGSDFDKVVMFVKFMMAWLEALDLIEKRRL